MMISERLHNLEKKYKNTNIIDLPSILYWKKFGNIENEIKLINKILKSVGTKIAKKWIKEFVNSTDGKHWGAWFEIRLFDWLSKIGDVEIEPEYKGNRPDFKLRVNNSDIFIEAKSFIKSQEERRNDRLRFYLNHILSTIEYPVLIRIKKYELGYREIDLNIVLELKKILPKLIGHDYIYEDEYGNKVHLSIIKNRYSEKAYVLGPTDYYFVNTDLLKKPLKEKSQQHSTLRNENNLYIIALFIESANFSGQDVIDAWFGKPKYILDRKTLRILSIENDLSGLHFGKSKIFHRTVTGTIVFKISGYFKEGYRTFESWFIQNPYSNKQIDSNFFPVDHKFILLKEKENRFIMEWKR